MIPADSRKITTSEGQSYALFFALAANDRDAFGKLFQWTQNNLGGGDLRAHLPGWLWGKKSDEEWTLLDSNSASDSDFMDSLVAAGSRAVVADAAVHRGGQGALVTYRR